MGTQGGTGRRRSTKKERSTAEDDALNLIAREVSGEHVGVGRRTFPLLSELDIRVFLFLRLATNDDKSYIHYSHHRQIDPQIWTFVTRVQCSDLTLKRVCKAVSL